MARQSLRESEQEATYVSDLAFQAGIGRVTITPP